MKLFIKKSKIKNGVKETLWVDFTYNGTRYRKSLKLENTSSNRKVAKSIYIPKLQQEIFSGQFFKKQMSMPTVNEYMKVSFALRSGKRCESTIYGHAKNYARYIEPVFGKKKLNQIISDDITLWQNKLQKEEHLSKSTIQKIRSLLNTMFRQAVRNKAINIEENPLEDIESLNETEFPKVKRIPLQPFNSVEIKKILASSKGQKKNLIATLFFCGIRVGESIGLRWENINFENNTISIRQQIVNGTQKILKSPKSQRIIPIIPVLLPFLKAQYKLTGKDNGFVFLTERSKKHFHSAGRVRDQIWVKALESAKVKYRNLHQTRGTFISTLIAAGEDITFVSKIAGHSDLTVTLKSYSEYIPVQNENFGSCFK